MATSPCRFATSLSFARRGMFWRKPKQGEVSKQGAVKTERASGVRLFSDSFMNLAGVTRHGSASTNRAP